MQDRFFKIKKNPSYIRLKPKQQTKEEPAAENKTLNKKTENTISYSEMTHLSLEEKVSLAQQRIKD